VRARHPLQSERGPIDLLERVRIRLADDGARGIEGPRVIGAREPARLATSLGDLRAAVRARDEERSQLTAPVPRDQHRHSSDGRRGEGVRARQLTLPADDVRTAPEEPLAFALELNRIRE